MGIAGSDEAILATLGGRLRQHRLSRNLTQAQLASAAGVSLPTVQRVEDGASIQLATLLRVLRALDLLGGVEALVPDTEVGPMDLLRRQGRRRQRATGRAPSPRPWTWGD